MLTEIQKTQFEVFGFVTIHQMLTSNQIGKLITEFEIGLADAESKMDRQSFRKQLNWWNLRPDTPYMASMMEETVFLKIAHQLLGQNAIGSFSASNSFSGDRTDWHPDAHQPHWKGLKFAVCLQSVDKNSGALRLIPGSHKESLHSEFKRIPLKESIHNPNKRDLGIEDIPAYISKVDPGDIIIFDNHIWHASYGGGKDRRLVTMGYFRMPTTQKEEIAVFKQVEAEIETRKTFPLLVRHPKWVAKEECSRIRQSWIDILQKYGFIKAQTTKGNPI